MFVNSIEVSGIRPYTSDLVQTTDGTLYLPMRILFWNIPQILEPMLEKKSSKSHFLPLHSPSCRAVFSAFKLVWRLLAPPRFIPECIKKAERRHLVSNHWDEEVLAQDLLPIATRQIFFLLEIPYVVYEGGNLSIFWFQYLILKIVLFLNMKILLANTCESMLSPIHF